MYEYFYDFIYNLPLLKDQNLIFRLNLSARLHFSKLIQSLSSNFINQLCFLAIIPANTPYFRFSAI